MAQSYPGLSDLKSRVHRSGHDIGRKVTFSAKTGEILPIWWDLASPNDTYDVRIEHFTRTQPVNTAAFTRIREYVDVYEVPLRQLWRSVDNAMLDINQVNPLYASAVDTPLKTGTAFPYVTTKGLANYIASLCTNVGSGVNTPLLDSVGFYRAFSTFKLLTYLRYGHIFPLEPLAPTTNELTTRVKATFPEWGSYSQSYGSNVPLDFVLNLSYPTQDVQVNLFPLLAYQKIYSDFYRNTHWEERAPQTYNVDYMSTTMALNGFPGTGALNHFSRYYGTANAPKTSMFDMRYCDFNKDLFFGVNPDSQFGDEAYVAINPISTDSITLSGSITGVSDGGKTSLFKLLGTSAWKTNDVHDLTVTAAGTVKGDHNLSLLVPADKVADPLYSTTTPIGLDMPALAKLLKVSGSASGATFHSQFSILALRQAEALQRYREVIGSGSYDIVSQIEKMFGYKMPANLSGLAIYRGGYASNLNISEVLNTNLVDSPADVKGKGLSSGADSYRFTASDYSCIMVLYHNKPLVEWNTQAPDPQLMCVDGQDFPKPAFDNIGMEPVSFLELMQVKPSVESSSFNDILGYQPRYYAWKTKTDDVLGAFATGQLNSWVSPITPSTLYKNLGGFLKFNPSAGFFKVHPQILDSIFFANADNTFESDQFYVNMNVDVKVVRSLSNDGLEY